jgi:phosphoglycolate phosphatase-like HAD superfamily hydrolase
MYIFLFDIDGTLLSSGGAGKAAMEAALTEEFGVTDIQRDVPYSGRTDRAIGQDLFRVHALHWSPSNWQRFLAGYLRLLPAYLQSHQGAVLPGIEALLRHLRTQSQAAIGLLTGNVRQGARLKLGHYGIYDYFGFGGFGDHHLDRNDVAQEALQEVQKRFNGAVEPGRIWVIGDTPLDISCARSIGARVAAVATGWYSRDQLAAALPDLVLSDLSDPSPLLSLCPG